MNKPKLLILTTIPLSLIFFRGQVRFLKSHFNIELVSSPGEYLETIAKEEGVKSHAIEIQREISIFKDFKSLILLWFFFLKNKPQLIHGSTPKAGLLAMIAGFFARVPVRMYYVHGLRYQGTVGFKRKMLIKFESLSCLFATHIFAVSQGVQKAMIKDSVTEKPIQIIFNGSVNGIDTVFFSPTNPSIPDLKTKFGINKNDFVYGFVGRIVRDKGIEELVNSFLDINKNYPNTKLLLIGGFEDKLDPIGNTLKEEIFTNKNIIFAGFQKDVRPFLKMMDVFVFPSYREGFGVSIMEAAAMNVPSIASDIIGCNEIIKSGYNGLLVPPKSKKELLIAMAFVLKNPDIISQMKCVCRQHVIDSYDQAKVWDATLKSYLNIKLLKK